MGNSRSNIQLVGNTTQGQNVGEGLGLFKQKVFGNTLQFRTLKEGANIKITQDNDEITISGASGNGGEGSPGGIDGSVQYNANGAFSGTSLNYDDSTETFTVGGGCDTVGGGADANTFFKINYEGCYTEDNYKVMDFGFYDEVLESRNSIGELSVCDRQITLCSFDAGISINGNIDLNSFSLCIDSTFLGFYGGIAVEKPTVSGSRDGNAALESLLTALSNLGLITDNTSA